MAKNIIILKGSPRPMGNSAALADRLAQGVLDAGGSAESVYLNGMQIQPCDGCDACVPSGVCILEDDMQKLYPKLREVGGVVLASPIYWFTYSAQLKACIDRWYSLWQTDRDVFKGKPFGIILTYGDSDLYTSGGINAVHTFESMMRFLEANIEGWVYGSVSNPGDAQKDEKLMEQAYQLGQRLARKVSE